MVGRTVVPSAVTISMLPIGLLGRLHSRNAAARNIGGPLRSSQASAFGVASDEAMATPPSTT